MKQEVQHRLRARRGRGFGVLAAAVLVVAAAFSLFVAPVQARAADSRSVDVDVPFHVRVHGGGWPRNEKFAVVMEPMDGTTVEPEEDTLTTTAPGKVTFKLSFTEVGEYRYKVYQKAGDTPYMDYDDTVFEVVIQIGWKGGVVAEENFGLVSISFDNGKAKVTDPGFDNDYNPPVTPPDPDKPDPDNPDKPDPDEPDPDNPDKPDPDNPDQPDNPDTPDTPDEPDNPDQPKPETPDKPKTDNPDKPSGVLPQTGDQIALYVGGACVLGVAAVAAGVALKRRSNRQ